MEDPPFHGSIRMRPMTGFVAESPAATTTTTSTYCYDYWLPLLPPPLPPWSAAAVVNKRSVAVVGEDLVEYTEDQPSGSIHAG